MYGEVAKVIYLATDITNERIMELESRKYTDQLKIQEDKLKLASVELKKKLEQTKTDMEAQYQLITRERNRFERTLIYHSDIVLTIDQGSRIIFINQAGEKFWNIKAGTILGKDIKSLFPGETDQYDSFLVSLFSHRTVKITGEKKNVKIPGGDGRMHTAQILLSMSETSDEVSYTAFISLS
jgi:signal transduction histidine kinase